MCISMANHCRWTAPSRVSTTGQGLARRNHWNLIPRPFILLPYCTRAISPALLAVHMPAGGNILVANARGENMHGLVCDSSHFSYVLQAPHGLLKLGLLVQAEGSSTMRELTHSSAGISITPLLPSCWYLESHPVIQFDTLPSSQS